VPTSAPSPKSPFAYQRRLHAARTTNDYVFAQLIPYIGNKRKLLPLIAEGLERCGAPEPGKLFVDLFTGSTVVARMARRMGWSVLANDWEPYAHEIARGTVALAAAPAYPALGGVDRVFAQLAALPPREDWVSRFLCPRDDAQPDPDHERMFFTRENGLRIDAVRCQIESWEADGAIDSGERAYLLSALLYAASYVSNTSGVWKAFHRGWGGATRTALYRIHSTLELAPPPLWPHSPPGFAASLDAVDALGACRDRTGCTPHVVYLDPPYNQHPYGSNYHVLNSLVLWDRPELSPTTVVDGKTVDKAAIRKDWTQRRSAFNRADTARSALGAVVEACEAPWVLLSYSTDGFLTPDEILDTLRPHGRVEVLTAPYKRYRVSAQRPSPRPETVEFLAILSR